MKNETGARLSSLRVEDHDGLVDRALPPIGAGETRRVTFRVPSSGENTLVLADPARLEQYELVGYYEGELRGTVEVGAEDSGDGRSVRVRTTTNAPGYEDGSKWTSATASAYSE